ncbi:MAG: Peptide chain release factor 2, partial [uncultured Frankineae bacterium]
ARRPQCRPRRSRRHAQQHREGARPAAVAHRAVGPRGAGRRARPVGRHQQGAGDHHPAVHGAGRHRAGRVLPRTPGRPRRAVPDGRRGGGRRYGGRGRGRAVHPAARDRQPRGAHAAVGRVRPARGPRADHPGRGRRRQPGLGAHALAHVLPLGRAARLPARRARVAGGRGGRREERRLPVQGPVRLRHPCRRARRPPAGAHLAVRQPGAAADVVRDGRRDARRGHRGRGRGRREGDPRRRVPLQRSRRSGRQHDRLGSADHPPAEQHRRVLPERALADPEPRRRHDRPADQAARAQARAGAGRDGRHPRHQGRHRLRLADPQLRAAPLPDGQGPADRHGVRRDRAGAGRRDRRLHRGSGAVAPYEHRRRGL